jgi:REP element-mobilizing transposase RayT
MSDETAHAKARHRTGRLREYNYATPGAYFVTICTHRRLPLFGTIDEGILHHSPAGVMAYEQWEALPGRFSGLELDAFIVMPNHVHGVLWLQENTVSLTRIVGAFKSLVVHYYAERVKAGEWPPYPGMVWQRSFYEHVIRGERALEEIREYIVHNAKKWESDPEYIRT